MENKPMTVGELVNERIIRLGITYQELTEKEIISSINFGILIAGRKDQIKDELEFLERLQKAIG